VGGWILAGGGIVKKPLKFTCALCPAEYKDPIELYEHAKKEHGAK